MLQDVFEELTRRFERFSITLSAIPQAFIPLTRQFVFLSVNAADEVSVIFLFDRELSLREDYVDVVDHISRDEHGSNVLMRGENVSIQVPEVDLRDFAIGLHIEHHSHPEQVMLDFTL